MRVTGELSFFEIGVPESERARKFYEGLFGWGFEPGPSEGAFEVQAPGTPAGLHGGDPQAKLYLFFRVDDIAAAVERVTQLGGEVQDVDLDGDEETIAKLGRFKLCRDDQGSQFGLHEPPPNPS